MPFRETDRTDHPLTLYAATKKATEDMAHSYAHLWKIPTTAFRFFTVYGPWGRPDMALFKFVAATLRGEPIDVYGHGEMKRDFTYIDDLVEAVVRLLDKPPREGEPVGERGFALAGRALSGRQYRRRPAGRAVAVHRRRSSARSARRSSGGCCRCRRATCRRPGPRRDLLRALTGYVPETDVDAGRRGVRAMVSRSITRLTDGKERAPLGAHVYTAEVQRALRDDI